MRKSDKRILFDMFSFLTNLLWDIRHELHQLITHGNSRDDINCYRLANANPGHGRAHDRSSRHPWPGSL